MYKRLRTLFDNELLVRDDFMVFDTRQGVS
jgi:hypothetical protein